MPPGRAPTDLHHQQRRPIKRLDRRTQNAIKLQPLRFSRKISLISWLQLLPTNTQEEMDMAKETGSSEHQTGTGDQTQTAEKIIKGVANLIPMGMLNHAKDHATAAFTFTKKLSQATDVHDRMRIHAEHAQMHIELFNERAKHLGDAMAVARNLVGAVA